MIVQSCTFTVHFPFNNNIREHFFNLEKHFTDFQKPFTLVPLPPDAPVELPRIVATSKHGHSSLTICGNSAQLITRFDEAFNKDISKCTEYVRSKCSSIIGALSVISGIPNQATEPIFYYSGITLTMTMDETDGISKPTEFINNNFSKLTTDLPTEEIQLRIAMVVKKTFYVNLMVQNNRLFNGVPDERGSIASLQTAAENLQIILDINDRFAFNTIQNYKSSIEKVNSVTALVEEFASHHVVTFIKTGGVNYGN